MRSSSVWIRARIHTEDDLIGHLTQLAEQSVDQWRGKIGQTDN